MPLARPSLEALMAQGLAETEAILDSGPVLPRAVLRALAYASAVQAHLMHGHIAAAARQLLPDTAELEDLDRHASLYQITRKPAAAAAGPVTFSGNIGAVIAAGTDVQSAGGVVYRTATDVAIEAGGTSSPQALALVAGSAGNLPAGAPLTLVSPVAGVQSKAVVAAGGLAGGADPESDEALRARVLAHLRSRPRGGSASDYRAWALEIPGVTRAWVLPGYGGAAGVGVTFVTDDDPGGLIPSATIVKLVNDYIESERPVGAKVTVFAPAPVPVNFVIGLAPLTEAVKATVEAALRDLLDRDAAPGQALLLSRIHEAIATAPGESDHVISVPSTNVAIGLQEIATFGSVQFTTIEEAV